MSLTQKIDYWNGTHTLYLNDLWLFPKIKSALKVQRFQHIEDIQQNVMTALKAIPQQEF